MEKFNDIFRLTANVFHGIIATEVFVYFSEISVDQFKYFLILTFFTIINVFTWNLVLLLIKRARGETTSGAVLMTDDISRLRYRSIDVLGLTVLALVVGTVAGVLYQRNVVLNLVGRLVDVEQTYNRSPFIMMSRALDAGDKVAIDGRPDWIREAHRSSNYLRVFMKDRSVVYEGYAKLRPTVLEQREIVLSPACRLKPSGGAGTPFQATLIEGPGVFLRVTDDVFIEILDWEDSPCAQEVQKLRESHLAAAAASVPETPMALLCRVVASYCGPAAQPGAASPPP